MRGQRRALVAGCAIVDSQPRSAECVVAALRAVIDAVTGIACGPPRCGLYGLTIDEESVGLCDSTQQIHFGIMVSRFGEA